MNDVAADASQDLPGRLGVAVQLLAHVGKATGGPGELTPTRLTALAVMSAAGPMRMGALASRLGIQVSTLSRIVDVMVAAGWAERRADEADHRACVIGITDAGTDLIDSVRHSNETRLAECIARLGPDDLVTLRAALPVLESLAEEAVLTRGDRGEDAPEPPDARLIAKTAVLSGARNVRPGAARRPRRVTRRR